LSLFFFLGKERFYYIQPFFRKKREKKKKMSDAPPPTKKLYPIVILKNGKAGYAKRLKPGPMDENRCYHRVMAISPEEAETKALEQHKDPANELSGSKIVCAKNIKANKEAYERELEKLVKVQGKKRKRDEEKEKKPEKKKPEKKKAEKKKLEKKKPEKKKLEGLDKRLTELEARVNKYHPDLLGELFGEWKK
jgi:hypothetical protein